MQGTLGKGPDHLGIIPRALDYIFTHMNGLGLQLSLSYCEIYNEAVRDLLVDSNSPEELRPEQPRFTTSTKATVNVIQGLEVRENLKDGSFYVPRLTRVVLESRQDAMDWLLRGLSNRTIQATDMNEHSSRSHTIFTVYVSIVAGMSSGPGSTAATAANSTTSAWSRSQTLAPAQPFAQLNLVDLAGSERLSARHNDASLVKETTNINKSLVCLGNVISALSSGQRAHVNFRDSKLTKLLKSSIGGDAKTLLIACISPAQQNNEESQSTMRFACRSKQVQTRARVAIDPRDATITALQREVLLLRQQLEQTQQRLADATRPTGVGPLALNIGEVGDAADAATWTSPMHGKERAGAGGPISPGGPPGSPASLRADASAGECCSCCWGS
jgi:hypothetical protein